MEEAWQVKCSSGWPVSGTLPPLPSVAAGSSNQIILNAQQFVRPIVHVKDLQNNPQEPFLNHPLTIDFGKSRNSDTSNSFLALLSGNSHGEFQHLPNSRTELAKLHFTDSFGLSTNQTFSATSNSSLSKSHGIDSILNGEPSSFITSRMANRFQTSVVQKDLQALDSYSHLMGHDKAVCKYPYQGINTSLGGASNRSCSSPLNSSKIAINYQNKQAALNDSSDANNIHGLIPSSLFSRGHPRVLCMSTAGEIFVNDMGLLGILCSCHGLPMSLAKFCLHSGLSTSNPSEDIRMENGMPLAKWWTMFSRNLIPGDSRGLDHSKPSLKECGFIGPKDSSFSLLSKNHGTMNSIEPFVGLGRSEELWKHSLHAHHPNLVEHGSLEKSVNIDIDSSYERGKSDANDLKLSRIQGLAQVGMPAENCIVKALKSNPKFLNTEGQDSTSNRQEPNIVSQLASNVNNRVISGNVSVSCAHLGPKNIFSQDKNILAQTNSSTEAFTVHSAGSELRLGQPSQHKFFSNLFATGMHSQFQAASPNVALQKVLSDRTEFHGETKRTKLNQQYPFPEAPSLDRRRLVFDGETATSLQNAESFDLSTYAAKDSSISLFLSHLTGETDIADSSDKLHDGIFYFTSSPHVDVPSSRESLAVCTRNEMNEIEKQPTLNGIDYGNGNGLTSTTFSDNYISKGGTNEIHVKPIEENGVFTTVSSVQYVNSSLVDMGNSSSILDQPFRVLNKEHESNNLNTHGNVTFHDDQKLDSKMIHGSTSRPSHWNDPSACLYSESSMNRSSTSCSCTTEKKCFFKHSSDGNMEHLTCGWHKSLIAKPEQLNSSFAMKPQLGRLCCLSAMEQPRSSCQDGLAHNDGDCCSIHRNTSDLHSSSNRFYNNVLLCKPGCAASYKYCSCASPQSSEPRPVFTCHVCGTDHNHCFRLRKNMDDTAENVGPKMCMHMGVSLPFSSKCCCAVISNCLTGHCFNAAFNNAHTEEGKTLRDRSNHLNSTCDMDAAFQEGRMVGVGQCTCFKKALAMKNNCQSGLWKDVSGKAMGYPTGTTDKLLKASENIIVDNSTLSVSKELNATFKASTSGEEHQMSNLSSRSSAPAVTDASVEVNKRDLQLSIVDNQKVLQYPEQDEGSGTEKCSSSIEVPGATECKEVPDTSCELVPCKSGPCWTSSHSSGRSYEQKRVMDKFSPECTIQGTNCHRQHLAGVWQLGNMEDSSKQEYLNVMDHNGYSLVAWSNPPNSMDESKCLNPSSKIAGVAMQPEGVVEGSSSTKRKRFVFPSRFISLKKLEKYHNTKDSADKHALEEQKLSVSNEEKLDISLNWKRSTHQSLSHRVGERPLKYMSLSCISDYKHNEAEGPLMRKKPVVCGNSGIISSGGLNDSQKLARMVPLNLILKRATRCKSNWEMDAGVYESTEKGKECAEIMNEHNSDLCVLQDAPQNPRPDRKNEANFGKLLRLDLENYLSKIGFWKATTVNNSIENMDDTFKKWKINRKRVEPFPLDVDELCCVCRLSNKEQTNCLLECNRCNIKVHQACYGISKVPKGLWYCRPCKTNTLNIACVLCGYEGGAMTRALESATIVRSLLKAWNVTYDSNSRILLHSHQDDQVLKPSSSGADEAGCKFGFLPSEDLKSSKSNIEVDVKAYEYNQTSNVQGSNLVKNRFVHNTIIEGVFEPSTIQWVHVVCGLWTPGTRCPNVNTMSAFDVSGASPAGKNIVCSICKRPGGTCIRCRVVNCSIYFHPWCAHQKGLLQSEIEGNENEKVGFYGSCRIHAANNYVADDQSLNVDELLMSHEAVVCSSTCARVEEFKGRKNERGFNQPQNDEDGCIVSQVQINAWLHINGQKSCIRGALKPTCSDVEHDHRKEYIRYKLSKAWKHLVVYKSGIHALGLYTSQFIARGAMVVEYVGEIVGLRVADKRETEYQSGGRLQCKSACYFFRIDKEHIVDATRKGGIARFVNHSCLPNCVAKIISIRNDKKVVFSAERDIFPGEEITYDYHFNREDEGKRIPCLCKSKNCRRYLN
ncbi:hypothetical protein HPP92_000484 [Vanilla planifolia]|uniref:Uncharacterized protein n=1 Tax=Vanilla planifolia TaxID=51239 RepID=A0A835RS76_VANPL|nr:hypothetical protein HPP92_000484 [Vanilla planifolia]